MRQFQILSLILSIALISCKKDERQANKSMEGTWMVTSEYSEYATFGNSGYAPDSTFSQTGELGSLIFSDDLVDYDIHTRDSTFSSSASWELTAEKVNDGFTRVNRFTLTIGNDLKYEIQFGDQTTNAEKNATTATLISIPNAGYGVRTILEMEK